MAMREDDIYVWYQYAYDLGPLLKEVSKRIAHYHANSKEYEGSNSSSRTNTTSFQSKTTTMAKAAKKATKATKPTKAKAAAATKRGGAGKTKTKSNGGGGGISKAVEKKINAWFDKNTNSFVEKMTKGEEGMPTLFNSETAQSAIKAYRQFLILVREMKDRKCKELRQLMPCCMVIEVMEIHRESTDYQEDMKLLCGSNFGKDMLAIIDDTSDLFFRELTTFEIVKQRFEDDFNEKVWGSVLVSIVQVIGGVNLNSMNPGLIWTDRNEPLSSALEVYAKDEENGTADLKFLLLRTKKVVNTDFSAFDLSLTSEDILLEIGKNDILLEAKNVNEDESEDRLFLSTDRKTMMTNELQDLAKSKGEGTDKSGKEECSENNGSSYSLCMFNAKRLYGFETPMSLELKNFDCVEVIPKENYKCENCICCNRMEHDM